MIIISKMLIVVAATRLQLLALGAGCNKNSTDDGAVAVLHMSIKGREGGNHDKAS